MKLPFLRMFKPWMQMLYVFTFIVLGSMLAEGIIFILGKVIWGINVFESTEMFNDPNDPSIINFRRIDMIISLILIFILPATVFRRLMEFEGQDFLGVRKNIQWKTVLITVVVFFLSFIVCNTLYYYNTLLDPSVLSANSGEAFRQLDQEQKEAVSVYLFTEDLSTLLINIFAFGVLTAIGEELIFRSIFLRLIMKMTGKVHLAVFIGAALFSFAHFSYFMFLPRLFMGMVLGYIYIRTANVWYCIIFHFINNSITVSLPYFILKGYSLNSFDQLGSYGWTIGLGTALLLGGLAYLIFKEEKVVDEKLVEDFIER